MRITYQLRIKRVGFIRVQSSYLQPQKKTEVINEIF
jgi:spore cortex formation protein SpoVR/YcgB (stage V sporulation)